MNIDDVKKIICKITDNDISNVAGLYQYGSVNYGSMTSRSDVDYVVICKNFVKEYIQTTSDECDFHIMSSDHYDYLIDKHDIMALECHYLKHPIIHYEDMFKLNLQAIRHSLSAVISNLWVKAKKKINQGDVYIGTKSIYHSFRIMDYGIQIASNNSLNYNQLLPNPVTVHDLELCDKTWEYFEQFKHIHKARATIFRGLTIK